MFSKDGPHPWNTRKGESRLEAEIEAAIARKTQDPVIENVEVTEKVEAFAYEICSAMPCFSLLLLLSLGTGSENL